MNHNATQLMPPATLREKLAQLMIVRIGSNLPPVRKVEQDVDRISNLLDICPIGGLIVFNGDREETPATLESLQSRSAQPLLVAADIERGVGQQLHGPTLFPHALAFEALGDDAARVVEEFANLTAIEARSAGLHVSFSPVADVNVDPRNPIIATRAFGDNPERVAELVAAYVRGCQAGGLLSTAKHFPGHGNTHEDSHHALPTVTANVESLDNCELVPFRAAIAAGVPLVMSAHVRYPAWDDSGLPATLSHPILVDLLRQQLGFAGAVISDSLLMEGVKQNFASEGELAEAAMLAGVDILLDVAEPVATLAALEAAVQGGRLPEARIEEAFARMWRLKEVAFASSHSGSVQELAEQTTLLAKRVAVDSIRVDSKPGQLLPFNPSKKSCVVLVRPYQSHLDPPEQPLGAAVRQLSTTCDYFELGPQSKPADYQAAISVATFADQVLVVVIVKPAAWHAFGLLPEQVEFVEELTRQQNCVLASLGTPEVLHEFEFASVKCCTHSDVAASQSALAEFVFQN